jgi:splicing factor 3B subunit 3
VVVYATTMGAIGAFYPFTSREDADFFMHLEMHMRQVLSPAQCDEAPLLSAA